MISSTLKVKRSCSINQRCLWWDVVKNKATSKQQQRQYKKRLLTIFNYHTKKKKKTLTNTNTNNNYNNNNNHHNNDTKEHNKIGDIFLHSGAFLRLLVLLVVFCTSMQQLDCVEFAASTTTSTRTTTVSSVLRTTTTTTINHSSNIAHNFHDATISSTTTKNSMQDEATGETIKRKYRRKLINNPTNQENILRYSIYKGKRRKHLKHPINRKYSNAPSTPSPAVVVITPPTTTRMPTTYNSNIYMQQQQHQIYMSTEHSKNTMPKSIMLQQQHQQQQQQILQSRKEQQTFIQHQQQQQQQQHDITHVSQARKYLHVYETQQQQQQQQEQKFMSPTRMNNATTVKGVHWQKQHGIIYQQLPRNLSYPKQHQQQQQQQQHRNKHTSSSVFNKSSSNRKDHVIAEGKTDIILYRNVVGPLPCPPGLSPHRVVPVYTQKHPTNQRHQGKRQLNNNFSRI